MTMARIGAVISCMVLFIFVANPINAETYTVGDTNGWALGVDYSTWAAKNTFKVGDSLVFNYGTSHTVSEVSSSDYSLCSSSNALSTDRSGSTTITLKTPGQHYFVCGVPGHCDGGQKLVVKVSDSSTDTPASTSTAPPSENTTPETPGTVTNTPTSTKNNDVPTSSSATSLSAATIILFMAYGGLVSKLIV